MRVPPWRVPSRGDQLKLRPHLSPHPTSQDFVPRYLSNDDQVLTFGHIPHFFHDRPGDDLLLFRDIESHLAAGDLDVGGEEAAGRAVGGIGASLRARVRLLRSTHLNSSFIAGGKSWRLYYQNRLIHPRPKYHVEFTKVWDAQLNVEHNLPCSVFNLRVLRDQGPVHYEARVNVIIFSKREIYGFLQKFQQMIFLYLG